MATSIPLALNRGSSIRRIGRVATLPAPTHDLDGYSLLGLIEPAHRRRRPLHTHYATREMVLAPIARALLVGRVGWQHFRVDPGRTFQYSLLTPSHAQGEFPFQSNGLESGAKTGTARGV